MIAPTSARVTVDDGVDLNCLEWGQVDASGPPVLLVHGLASNARVWGGVARRLAGLGHHVVAVDQRGHGGSSKPSGGYDFATLTGDLLDVIARYGWTEDHAPFAAGQSWGANVVLELAARHPGSVTGIALVDGGMWDLADRFADWPTCEAALAPPVLEGMPAERFETLVRAGHPGWPEEGIQGTLANMEFLSDGTIRPWLSRSNHMTILRHLWEHHPSKRFAEITLPVLLMPADDPTNQRWTAGKRDSVQRAAEALAAPIVRPLVGDHDLHAQHPSEVAGLIDDAARQGRSP
ncbi:MAG TPA: alpha/beta hydrolase [Acidimicrobiales bacterium]|nr:alpha/beta hydrolase [Acidimicrobiales bacterium]